jgi:Mn-dependent DtxR family transcriptional regulator
MSLSFDGKRLRATIKQLMKKNGARYEDLAKALSLSLPTVKRMLTKDDFPIERAVFIANWLGVSFPQLIELATQNSGELAQFSEGQEDFFVKNPRAFLYFHLLLSGWSTKQVSEKFGFKKSEAEKLQFSLEKMNLLEVWPGGRLRLKAKGPHQMIRGGKLERKFFSKVADTIFIKLRNKVGGYSDPDHKSSHTLFRPFEIVMSDKNYAEMVREQRAVLEKYRAIGAKELQMEPREKLKHVSGLLAADFYYMWEDILN